MTRRFDASDLHSAARGLGMWGMDLDELAELEAEHAQKEAIASQVIAEAARQVRAARRALRRNPTARESILKRPALKEPAALFKKAVEASKYHARLLSNCVEKYGERGPWISGIGQEHFPADVKNQLREAAANVARLSDEAWAARPPRVRMETMRELAAATAKKYGSGFYGPQPNPSSGDTAGSARVTKRRDRRRAPASSRYRAQYRIPRQRARKTLEFNASSDVAALRYANGLGRAKMPAGAKAVSLKRTGPAKGAQPKKKTP